MKLFSTISIAIMYFLSFASITGCLVSDMEGVARETFFTKKYDTINYHKSEEYLNTRLHRVLLLPFTIESQRDKVVDEVTDAFYIELQKSGKFEIIVPQGFQDILSQQNDIWNRGLIRSETIEEAKKRYKVDAILFGTITQYQPYEPPVLGIKIGMFSAISGNIMWSSDAIFDSSDASVIKLVKTYYKEHYKRNQSLYDWKIILLSMKRYAQFVAYHMVDTL
ncbi:MAG: hypothetical protein HOI47_15855 [Candidatus Scalindua sp.]|jgi:hypothetical protein|nr:hypothetical protein [Candidatus Scalindua sp.]